MKIKVINRSKHELPAYSAGCYAGMDIRADLDKEILLKPMDQALVKTGTYIEIPAGYEAQIRPGSRLAISKRIKMFNSPGTMDADYGKEVRIMLINLSGEDFVIKVGETISQMVIAGHENAERVIVDRLLESAKGSGGFRHTGKE
jgi:dUTP pyrophosphatase